MTCVLTALRAFFRVLGDRRFADSVTGLLAETGAAAPEQAVKPSRSEALTLLAALQREARLLDFLMEPVHAYSDAQIGAAARDIHDKSAKLLAEYFGVKPLLAEKEGAACTVPAGYDPVQYRVSGNLAAQAPFTGTLRHPGWIATTCKLPQWTGQNASAMVIAAAEVEVR